MSPDITWWRRILRVNGACRYRFLLAPVLADVLVRAIDVKGYSHPLLL